MKKIVLVLLLGVIIATGVFADHPSGWGIGVVGGGGWGYNRYGVGGLMLSIKAPNVPIFWGISVDFGTDYFGMGFTGDYYLIDSNITDFGGPNLGWYLGVGGFFGFGNYDGSYASWTSMSFGGRLPIGLSLQFPFPTITIELLVALVPNLGLGFWFWDPKYDDYWRSKDREHMGLISGIGGEFGIRFWF